MQLSNEEIMQKGIQCLVENLGEVETEYFIFNLKRQSFNYTEWQRDFFEQHFNLNTFLQTAQQTVDEKPFNENPNCEVI